MLKSHVRQVEGKHVASTAQMDEQWKTDLTDKFHNLMGQAKYDRPQRERSHHVP